MEGIPMGDKLEQLEELLKTHDWYYQMTEDHRVWQRGSQQHSKIRELVNELGNDGKDLYDRYYQGVSS